MRLSPLTGLTHTSDALVSLVPPTEIPLYNVYGYIYEMCHSSKFLLEGSMDIANNNNFKLL